MRSHVLAAVAATLISVGLAGSHEAAAGDWHWRGHGWHDGYDPYAYRYEPRGYYPYYNSGYWKPLHVMRKRCRPCYVLPPYYQAWGYPKRGYHHRQWHAEHHGRIRHHHW
jgi:hypothetical protein